MKKWMFIFLFIFLIPFKVDALQITGNIGINNQVMQGDEEIYTLSLKLDDTDMFTLEDIESIDFDIVDSFDELLCHKKLENSEWSFQFDATGLEVGSIYLKNIKYVINGEEYTYDGDLYFTVYKKDNEGPTLGKVQYSYMFEEYGSVYISPIGSAQDSTGISSYTIVLVNDNGDTVTLNETVSSSSSTNLTIRDYNDRLSCGLWKIKSIKLVDSSYKHNVSVYTEDNFDFSFSYFYVYSNNLKLTNASYSELFVVDRFVNEDEDVVIKLKVDKNYSVVFIEVDDKGSYFGDDRYIRMYKEGDYYVARFKPDYFHNSLGTVISIYVANDLGGYARLVPDYTETYFRILKEEKNAPIILDYYVKKNKYIFGDSARYYFKIVDDDSDKFYITQNGFLIYTGSLSNRITVYNKQLTHAYDDWYYVDVKTNTNSKQGLYQMHSIELRDEYWGYDSFNYFTNKGDFTLYGYPDDIEIVEVPNRKYAINEIIEIDGFKVNGIYEDGSVFDVSNMININSLTEVGEQSASLCVDSICKDIILEGFIPSIVSSKDEITIRYDETIDFSKYISLDDDRYNFDFTYEFIENYSIVENNIFKPKNLGKHVIRVSTKNDVYKDIIVNVNGIPVTSVSLDYFPAKGLDIRSFENNVDYTNNFLNHLKINTSYADTSTIKFESLTPQLIEISEDGKYRLLGIGLAKIRVFNEYGLDNVYTFDIYRGISGSSHTNNWFIDDTQTEINVFDYVEFYPLNHTENIKFIAEGINIDENGNIYGLKAGLYNFKLKYYIADSDVINEVYELGSFSIKVYKTIKEFYITQDSISFNGNKDFYIEYYVTDTNDYSTFILWDYDQRALMQKDTVCDENTGRCKVCFESFGYGKFTIKGRTLNYLSDSIIVNISNPLKKIVLNASTVNLQVGGSYQFTVNFDPLDTTESKNITWSVSNTSIAKIDKNGKLTVLSNPSINQSVIIVTAKAANGLSVSAKVYVDHPSNVGVITAKQDSTKYVKLSWARTKGDKYTIYRATSKNGSYKKIGTTSKLYYVDKSVKAGTTYYYKVKNDWTNKYSPIAGFITPPSKPSVTVSNYGFDTLKITYKKLTGAARYDIYRSTSKNGTYTKVRSSTGTTYYDKKLTYNKTYYYKVKACNKNNICSDYSTYKSKKVTAGKPSITVSASGATGIKIKYKKVTYATKYQIYRSTSKSSGYKLVKETTGLSYTDKVIPGVTYYYKVRACGGNQCGSYSSVKSKKLTLGKTTISKISLNANKQVTLTYKKIDGALGYEIYRSTKKSSGYKKIGTTTSTTYIDKTELGKTYYYKIKVYTKNGTKVIYSSYSSVKSIKVK